MLSTGGLKTVYTRVGEQPRGNGEITEDTIGVIQFEFVDWQKRPTAHVIMDEIRAMTHDIAGTLVEVRRRAPVRRPAGDPGAIVGNRSGQVAGRRQESRDALSSMPEIRDLDDGLPLPGIDWKIKVDKAEAAKYGASPDGRQGRATRHQRRQGHRISSGRQR